MYFFLLLEGKKNTQQLPLCSLFFESSFHYPAIKRTPSRLPSFLHITLMLPGFCNGKERVRKVPMEIGQEKI